MANFSVDYVATRKDAAIVGLVYNHEENAKDLAKRKKLNVPIFTDLAKTLEKADANLVFDVTIPSSRKEIVKLP